MSLHQRFKKNEDLLNFCLKHISTVNFVVTICGSNTWINNFCKENSLSYIQVNDTSVKYLKRFSSILLINPVIVYVYTNGTEYWVIKAFVENCKCLPNFIITSFNYIAGTVKKITVPYTQKDPKTKYDVNYQGCSLNALVTLLKKHNYKYLGVFRYAQGVIFVKDDEQQLLKMFDSNVGEILDLPNVSYGVENRWPLVRNKFWVNIL